MAHVLTLALFLMWIFFFYHRIRNCQVLCPPWCARDPGLQAHEQSQRGSVPHSGRMGKCLAALLLCVLIVKCVHQAECAEISVQHIKFIALGIASLFSKSSSRCLLYEGKDEWDSHYPRVCLQFTVSVTGFITQRFEDVYLFKSFIKRNKT